MPYEVRYKLVEPAASPLPESAAPEHTGPFAHRDRAEDFAVAIAPRSYWVRISAEDDADAQEGRK